ncbi:hypothetical protein [Streptomyces sp. NPDC087437]|uniref:hypothetical protein n=1 Tax=Streptomyces sp. NPDC087437 TaxID=3365789 RepID=UPI0038053EF4
MLVHEALRIPPGSGLTAEVIGHHLKSHVLVYDVGPIAQKADVPSVVLSHIEVNPKTWPDPAQRGLDSRVTVGRDLMTIPLSRK